MNLLKHIFSNKKTLLLILFIGLHLILININSVEWGDSYRILRAAEYLKNGSYPVDEKRPPLLSLVLATRPAFVDPVVYARLVLLVFSILSFVLFMKLLNTLSLSEKSENIALFLLILNPVYLYWSLRIMADVPFTVFVLLGLYLFYRFKLDLSLQRLVILGIVAGLSVLVRFEGYILFVSILGGVLLPDGIKTERAVLQRQFRTILSRIKYMLVYIIGFLLVAGPYILIKNPFGSSYFEEPAGRTYDLQMVAIYLLSILFILGFASFLSFLFFSCSKITKFLLKNTPILIFLLLELILILFWPAAIPRLFVPIIPLLIIMFSLGIDNSNPKFSAFVLALNTLLVILFIGGQFMLKLQFLVPSRELFTAVAFIQVLSLVFLVARNERFYLYSIVVSMFICSFSVIWSHKDILSSVKWAGLYASENLQGKVGYNDVSSVSDWYLNYNNPSDDVYGTFHDINKSEKLSKSVLEDKSLDYLIITNEHNSNLEVDISKRDYLTLVEEFGYTVNDKYFFAKIVKIN